MGAAWDRMPLPRRREGRPSSAAPRTGTDGAPAMNEGSHQPAGSTAQGQSPWEGPWSTGADARSCGIPLGRGEPHLLRNVH